MSIIIGVDDGHGKDTPGKRSPSGYKENEFNHYTKEYLITDLKRCGFKVVDCSPTRNDNSLKNRCDREKAGNCDIFISIHFNAMGNTWQKGAEGIETYNYYNSSKGKILATIVHRWLMKGTKMNNRGVKEAGFYVLKYTKSPAILVECGFMDNKEDFILMKSDEYRKECSHEICQGICEYFGVKYIPESTTTTKKDAATILKEVSPYYKIWNTFINNHQAEVNLRGLVELLYYTKAK